MRDQRVGVGKRLATETTAVTLDAGVGLHVFSQRPVGAKEFVTERTRNFLATGLG